LFNLIDAVFANYYEDKELYVCYKLLTAPAVADYVAFIATIDAVFALTLSFRASKSAEF
jgi:hypothetical protein